MHLKDKLKEIRKIKGWSQQQFADKLEEKRSTYAEWENGTIPSFDIVVKIASVSQISILEFVATVDEKAARTATIDEKLTINNKLFSADFLAGKLESKDETIHHIEARRKDAEDNALKMEAHYNDMKNALERAQTTINEVLKPIREQTQEILVNSREVRENTIDGIIEMQSEHRVIMDGMDQILKQPIGTTYGKADILEGASQEIRTKDHKKKSAHKQSKGD